jgi:hypothetical protein
MEGVRRLDERARVNELFPDRGKVVESIVNPERVRQSSTFTPDEWEVYFLVDGRRTIQEICEMNAGASDVETLEVLRRLVQANIVALRSPDEITARIPALEEPPEEAGGTSGAVAYSHASGPPARLVRADLSGETAFPLMRERSIIGRHRNCDVLLADGKVSAYHARVDRDGDGWSVVDLHSRNGTRVNGQRIQRATIKDGDVIGVGQSRLVLRVDAGRDVK